VSFAPLTCRYALHTCTNAPQTPNSGQNACFPHSALKVFYKNRPISSPCRNSHSTPSDQAPNISCRRPTTAHPIKPVTGFHPAAKALSAVELSPQSIPQSLQFNSLSTMSAAAPRDWLLFYVCVCNWICHVNGKTQVGAKTGELKETAVNCIMRNVLTCSRDGLDKWNARE
jgi:hypothetical protein